MTTNSQADPLIGRLVDGRYRVRARIARGGMATVYVATDLRLERRIALKVMHSHLSDDSVFKNRFIQEARAAARLSDPNVVNVFDQGQDGDLAYLVMEYLPGITLRELLREQKRLSVQQTITIMDAVLSGLSAAHRASIVHRDVKPENVLLAEDGRVKIGDFGLARATTANTATGQQLLGTIAYLAPELVTRGTADERSDIYSLGIMLYEMLVGEQPYKGEQPMQIAFQHATDSVPRPSVRNHTVPEQLDELVLWATEKSPEERPDDAQTMLNRLREIERELGISPLAAPTEPVRTQTETYEATKVLGGTSILGATKVLPGTGIIDTPENPAETVDNATLLRRRSAKRKARGSFLLTLVLLLSVLAGGAGWWFGSGPGSLVAVPDVVGQSWEDADSALRAEGFTNTQKKDEYSTAVNAGETIRTDPDSGERLDREKEITVVVSAGPAPHDFGPQVNLSADEVRQSFLDNNIVVAESTEEYFAPEFAENTVMNVRVTPLANPEEPYECGQGCTIFEGDTVTLLVSRGGVPDVAGKSLEEATTLLTEKGLIVSEERDEAYNDDINRDIAADHVFGIRDKEGGGYWVPNDTVKLFVSLGPQPIEVPNVVGMTVRQAVTELQEAGFRVNPNLTDSEFLFGQKAWDLSSVRSQTPASGTLQLPDATITLTPGALF